MSGLVKRANQIEIALGDLKRNEADADSNKTIVETSAKAQRLTSQLQGALKIKRSLSEDGLKIPSLPKNRVESATKAKTAARRTATTLEKPDQGPQDIVGILNGKGVQENALGEGETIAKALAKDVETALEDERQALLPKNLQDQITEPPGAMMLARKLRQAREALVTAVSVTPSDLAGGPKPIRDGRTARKSAVEAWEKNYSELNELLEKEDPEIRKFFREASSEDGASLSLLTDKVSKRLKKDGLTDSYRIRNQ